MWVGIPWTMRNTLAVEGTQVWVQGEAGAPIGSKSSCRTVAWRRSGTRGIICTEIMEEVGRRRDPVRETCEIEFRAIDRCREKFTSRNQEKCEMEGRIREMVDTKHLLQPLIVAKGQFWVLRVWIVWNWKETSWNTRIFQTQQLPNQTSQNFEEARFLLYVNNRQSYRKYYSILMKINFMQNVR